MTISPYLFDRLSRRIRLADKEEARAYVFYTEPERSFFTSGERKKTAEAVTTAKNINICCVEVWIVTTNCSDGWLGGVARKTGTILVTVVDAAIFVKILRSNRRLPSRRFAYRQSPSSATCMPCI